jgi:hypothetical protein
MEVDDDKLESSLEIPIVKAITPGMKTVLSPGLPELARLDGQINFTLNG